MEGVSTLIFSFLNKKYVLTNIIRFFTSRLTNFLKFEKFNSKNNLFLV